MQEQAIDALAVKRDSERVLLAAGARICDWLPVIEDTTPRSLAAIAKRVLILNALINLAYEAPPLAIRDWLVKNDLVSDLAESEKFIITAPEVPLTEHQLTGLFWSVEALWALTWAVGRIPELRFDQPVGDELVTLLPNLEANEPAAPFYEGLRRRSYAELYAMRDLIYRANWYARDGQLNGYATPPVDMDIIMERRKALEWATDQDADWDNTEQGT